MFKKLSSLILVATVALVGCSPEPQNTAPSGQADQQAERPTELAQVSYEEGVHYRRVNAIDSENATKPFIVEYFWLGCPHCQAFEAPLNEFIADNQNFTVVKKPAAGNARWAMDAKIYYGLKELGKLSHLDQLFDQYRDQPLPSKTKVSEFLTSIDVDAPAFWELVDSSNNIAQHLKTNNSEMRANEINGVPGIVVNGQYLVMPSRDVDFFALVTYLSTK